MGFPGQSVTRNGQRVDWIRLLLVRIHSHSHHFRDKRNASRGRGFQLQNPTGTRDSIAETELVLGVTSETHSHVAMRRNGDDIVSLLRDECIRQINHVEWKIGVSALLANGVPIHKQPTAHDHEVARRPDASSMFLSRSVLESMRWMIL